MHNRKPWMVVGRPTEGLTRECYFTRKLVLLEGRICIVSRAPREIIEFACFRFLSKGKERKGEEIKKKGSFLIFLEENSRSVRFVHGEWGSLGGTMVARVSERHRPT